MRGNALRWAPLALLGLLMGFLAVETVSAAAVTKNVKLKTQSYQPSVVQVKVGDTVRWTRATGFSGRHNVHQVKDIFRSGEPTFDKIDYKRRFSAGTYPYKCDFHGELGMRGTVKVPVRITPEREDGLPLIQWATTTSNTGTRHDVQYKVGAGPWTDWLVNGDGIKALFGQGSDPDLVAGEAYRFRARSQKVDGRESKYGPPKLYMHPS
jgi:plastocyanin